ncbi:DUF5367 family protein [Aneurinibacillus uraniidurans]|uniref:DUF5367 family protein n=1 Tax=Aneurinibacillus uraniidurans TaxID=2966586 RepID=UPI00234BEA4F|nr:DUF5367 family protein [Aneurinibacillus sp. B1]WCN39301.1 DUF5367 family protein [Aneurinibacillus sp. B1]
MKKYLYTALWGVLVWFFATLFFVVFGEYVLFSPGTNAFTVSISLLIVGTGILLFGVTYLYLLFDRSENAPLKFGVIGTSVGLTLDTFSLSNHQFIFPKLDDSQVIAFTAWMSFAYVLYLVIPIMINKIKKTKCC